MCSVPQQGATLRHRQQMETGRRDSDFVRPPPSMVWSLLPEIWKYILDRWHANRIISWFSGFSVWFGCICMHPRALFERFMTYLCDSTFCRKGMCALLGSKVITFILRLCHFPIRDLRAKTYLPAFHCLSPSPSPTPVTAVEATPEERWKPTCSLLNCWRRSWRRQHLARKWRAADL